MLPQTFGRLFWDIDPCTLDTRKHERIIISRLLNYGRLDAWRWLAETYGKHHLAVVLRSGGRLGVRDSARRLAELVFA